MLLASVTFANPWAWFLMIIPILMGVYFYFYQNQTDPTYNISNSWGSGNKTLKTKLKHYLPILPILSSIFLIIAIARPQGDESKEKSYTKGIDIILTIDVSTSMLEKDFKPDRLEAAKEVAAEFVEKRPNDRIGVVVFAGESYVLCPPTIDHNIVLKQIASIQNGLIEDGTAIGMGLATSVRALKNSNAKSRVDILLTDGVNTAGTIDPLTAVQIAKAYNVKVYCIGVGTPRQGILGIDEPLMRKISSETGGLYFRAGSTERLKQIYDKINKLETHDIEVNAYHKKTDKFPPWVWLALITYLTFVTLKYTWLRGI